MNRQTITLLAVLGGVLALIGLVLGLSPLSDAGYACGSAFAPDDMAAGFRAVLDGMGASNSVCQDTLAGRRGIALALLIPGALLLLVAAGAAYNAWEKSEDKQEAA